MFETVLYEVNGDVARITLNRPDVHNALNDVLLEELTSAIGEAARDPQVRILLLSGAGKHFSAGADVNWLKRVGEYSFDENKRDAARFRETLLAFPACPKPIVARVHGHAIAGATGLVAACDLAVSVPSAKFGLTEVRLGIVPAMVGPFVLRKIGLSAFTRLALTGDLIDAAEALRIGLVHQVVAPEKLDAAVEKLCDSLRRGAPSALALAKKLCRTYPEATLAEAGELSLESIARQRASSEGQAGLAAFLEKKTPPWAPPLEKK